MSAAAGLHIPPVPSHPVQTRRYAGLSPSRSVPGRHRQLVVPSDERFGSDREDCEEAGTPFVGFDRFAQILRHRTALLIVPARKIMTVSKSRAEESRSTTGPGCRHEPTNGNRPRRIKP